MANSGANGPVSGTTPTQTGCSMTCSGNSSEFCGGPDRLNVYHFTGTLPGPPVTNPPPAGGGGGGGTSNVKPVVEGLPSPWKYSGCYVYATFNTQTPRRIDHLFPFLEIICLVAFFQISSRTITGLQWRAVSRRVKA